MLRQKFILNLNKTIFWMTNVLFYMFENKWIAKFFPRGFYCIKRANTKNEILNELDILHFKLNEYLRIWKKCGGGTTGHAIGSTIKRTKELKEFIKNYC